MHPELEQFVRILPEPSFLLLGTGEILVANAAATAMTGIEASALRGAGMAPLIRDPESKVHDFLRLCARSRQLMPGSFTWSGADGRPVEMRCDGAVLVPRTETSPAVLFIRCRPKAEATDRFALLNQKIADLSREVLERKKAEWQRDELLRGERAARIEAERVSRMKDEFLATLSHELRTPLNAILGWSELLQQDKTLSDEVADGLDVIGRNARVQRQLVEDLLDMSRIISGRLRLSVQQVDLQPVIEAALETVRPAAEAKNIRLQVTLDPTVGPVKGDPHRLQQVVWNLLSNAVKFTSKGGRVQVFLERVNSHVEIIVSDTGEGMPPEFLPHVFERFRQADASITRQHGGLGLGLSIVKQIIELHGGSVRAKSPGEGKGSTFVVVLPLLVLHGLDGDEAELRSHPTAATGEPSPPATTQLAGVTVLVVDDEPDARKLVKRLLEGSGATVAAAASVKEAMELLPECQPQVIVSDIGMPGQDGYDLIRQLRALPREAGGKKPAIALTAFARSEDRTRAMRAGYNLHLAKPVEPAELIATVASVAGLVT